MSEHEAVRKPWWPFVVLILLLSTGLWQQAAAQRVSLAPGQDDNPAGPPSTSFHKAVESIVPAVVTIETLSGPRETRQWSMTQRAERRRNYTNSHHKPIYDDERDREGDGVASGVIIHRSGIIVTNYHVVEDADAIIVHLSDGRQFPAADIRADAWSDLAVLRIVGAKNLPVARLGDSAKVKVGDWVFSVGNPFGLRASVSVGVISAKDRKFDDTNTFLLQTDAATNPGNSGGPLVDMRGEVVGINEGASSFDGGFQGIGFAIPVNLVRRVTEELIDRGTVRRSFFGGVAETISPGVAEELGLSADQQGALLTEVIPATPAANSGFKVGDVIVTFALKTIPDAKHFQRLIQQLPPGKLFESQVLRAGTLRVFKTRLRPMPESPLENNRRPEATDYRGYTDRKLGLRIVNPTPEEIQQLGYEDYVKGALITEIHFRGAAYFNSIRAGMIVLRVGNAPIGTVADYQAAMKQQSVNDGILMLVGTPEGNHFLVVKGQDRSVHPPRGPTVRERHR